MKLFEIFRRSSDQEGRKDGYDGSLAKKIFESLKTVYPGCLLMPRDITEHPKYHRTMVVLIERGWIDKVKLQKFWGGEVGIIYLDPNGIALSDLGLSQMSKVIGLNIVPGLSFFQKLKGLGWKRVIENIVVAIVTAIFIYLFL